MYLWHRKTNTASFVARKFSRPVSYVLEHILGFVKFLGVGFMCY